MLIFFVEYSLTYFYNFIVYAIQITMWMMCVRSAARSVENVRELHGAWQWSLVGHADNFHWSQLPSHDVMRRSGHRRLRRQPLLGHALARSSLMHYGNLVPSDAAAHNSAKFARMHN